MKIKFWPSIKSGFTFIGLLMRSLVVLKRIHVTLEEISHTNQLRLRLDCILNDIGIEDLEAAEWIKPQDTQGDVLMQTEEELRAIHSMEEMYERVTGTPPPESLDMFTLKSVAEKEPGVPR